MKQSITFRRNRLAVALSSALVPALAASGAYAQKLEEVVVTATKRAASMQDIPIAVSALTEDSLDQRGISNFADYLLELPTVTAGGGGPGQNTIYIRGVASTTPNLTTAGVAGLSPNVALYLDEQPMTQPGRNLDVYVADINRVEVLSGPQGTLFGASSQSGVIRLITNKPDPTGGVYGNIKAGASFMKDGDMNNNVTAMLNLPVNDAFALRAVVYNDNKGGYIDNVRGVRTTAESARFRPAGSVRSNGVPVAGFRGGFQAGADLSNVTFLEADNEALVEEDFNDTTYTGGRISALWNINDDWQLRVGALAQQIDSDGTFYADPNLPGDFEIQRFEEDRLEDDMTSFNWTLEGRIGALEVLYTGAYTDRETDQRVDYSDYLFIGQYIPYYICDYYVSYTGFSPVQDADGNGLPAGTCQPPNLYVQSNSEATFETHEFRISTDPAERLRVTAGAFYSDMELLEQNDFSYPGNKLADAWGAGSGNGFGFAPNGNYPYDGAGEAYRPGAGFPYPADTIFRNDVKRTDEQFGVFGEVSFDLTDTLSITAGARYYDYEVDLLGSANSSFFNMGGTDINVFGTNINDLYDGDQSIRWTYSGTAYDSAPVYTPDNLPAEDDPNYQRIVNTIYAPDVAQDDGIIGKVSLSWTPNADQLWYVTWSEGFRTGLLNRPGGAYQAATDYTVPFDVQSDELINVEMGWKLDLMDGRMRFNGAAFFVDISDLQTTVFDTSIVNLFFSDNAADAEVRGIEGDVTWLASQGLTVGGAFSFLDTEITAVKIPTGDVEEGSELAYAPKFQGSLWARYEWSLDNGWTAHVMPTVTHSAKSYSDIIVPNRMEIDSWTMMNATAGVSTGSWMVEAFVNNITNEQIAQGANYVNDRERVAYAPPTTAGVRLSYDF